MASRTEQIRAGDGGEFPGHVALPESGSGPGILVIQEIFGVNDYIKGACERLARLGYVAMAPDLYWRLGAGIAIDEKEPGGLQKAFGQVGRLDFVKAGEDATAALEHLRGLPEVAGGRAGIIGFCLGGGVSYIVAALSDPVTCVSYYGSAVPDALALPERSGAQSFSTSAALTTTSPLRSRRRSGRLSSTTSGRSSTSTKVLAMPSTITTRR
jgi:carboxymethylenebutenolidase